MVNLDLDAIKDKAMLALNTPSGQLRVKATEVLTLVELVRALRGLLDMEQGDGK